MAEQKKPPLGEATTRQSVSIVMGDELTTGFPSGVSYATYRAMRKDPTIALARGLIGAAALAGSWSVEADDDAPDDSVSLIGDIFPSMREQIMEHAVFGGVDFGWGGFEKVFAERGGRIILHKAKPLLPDITTIMVTSDTGAFDGYRQVHAVTGQYVRLTTDKCLHIPSRVEGTQWYGTPLLENARTVCETWQTADKGAAA